MSMLSDSESYREQTKTFLFNLEFDFTLRQNPKHETEQKKKL